MKKIINIILLCLLLTTCDKTDYSNYKHRPGNVKSLNIGGADYLAIKVQKNKTTNDIEWSNLYKVVKSDNGLLNEIVGFRDGNDNLIDSSFSLIQIEDLCFISDDYICMKGRFEIEIDSVIDKLTFSSILVRISDGAIYDFNGHYPREDSYYMGSKYLQEDKSGNLYYICNSALFRLGGLDIGMPYQETYVSSSQFQSLFFYISPEANCFYDGHPKTKIKLNSGGIILSDRWLKNLFTSEEKTYAALDMEFAEVTLVDNICKTIVINSIRTPTEFYRYFYKNSSFCYLIGNMGEYGELGIVGFVFNQNENKVLDLSIPEFMENELYKIEDFRDKYLWISSIYNINKEFYRFNLDSFEIKIPYPDYENKIEVAILNSYELIEIPDSIEVYSYTILKDGEISFIGYNLSSEIDISGIISMDNKLTIIGSSSDYTYKILERIN
jgi:hypothetical protein